MSTSSAAPISSVAAPPPPQRPRRGREGRRRCRQEGHLHAAPRLRELITYFGGKVIHPVLGLPGGVCKPLDPAKLAEFRQLATDNLEFALFTLQVFKDIVLKNQEYVELITSDTYTHRTYYMGLVDARNRVNFYDGLLRVVRPDGSEYAKFRVQDYREYIAEHVETWSYVKFCYLKPLGWQGFEEGPNSSVYAVAPLARLNAADGMATPKAQTAYDEFYKTIGGKPVHHTLANHWARVVEMIQAAERIVELVNDPDVAVSQRPHHPHRRPQDRHRRRRSPRGTLIHHFETDPNGIVQKANLIVATQNNAARIAMSVDRAARGLIKRGEVSDGLLNMVEMAFRAYDPCFGCASHSLPGHLPLAVSIYDHQRQLVRRILQS